MSSQSGVYIKDKDHGWLPANVLEHVCDNTVKVSVSIVDEGGADKEERIIKLKDYEDGTLPLQNLDEGGNEIVVPDMCDLPSLHEAAILYNLKSRHETLNPYTRVGDIVIAMNPFHWIEGIYSKEIRDLYVNELIHNSVSNGGGGDCRANLDPHVYEVSSLAYKGLALDSHHQSILVSGESGAGKTETVKIVMSHLASVQNNDPSSSTTTTSGQSGQNNDNIVVRRVLDSNPLLEAFGNAKTIRNDNSSRFGKYIQLQFDVEDATTAAFSGKSLPSCVLVGSTCETYLLEKSRVVGHEESERTYHIFYQLLAAPDSMKTGIWKGLLGKNNASFKYVGETDTVKIENKTDGEKWKSTVDALELVGIQGDLFKDLMRAICITMQLGNLTFKVDPENDDGSVISSKEELVLLSDLMGVDEENIKKALTFRTIYAPKESYSVPLRTNTAKDSCDAFAKEIYQQTFDWLVSSINEATCAEKNYDDASNVEQYGHIGLLDIFGFESFKVNRFEQFCINYANEKLQSKYNLDIFSSVQEEYDYEGIAMPEISFSDNSEVVNLVESRMGLISMLNEECLRPHGNDSSFVSKMKKVNQDINALVKNPLHTPTQFAIQHYAAEVVYEATNFVQKNTDTLPRDLIECANMSSNSLLKNNIKGLPEQSSGAKGRKLSVSSKFRSQLTSLMTNISVTKSRYIRCIKPNPEKVPQKVNLSSSLEQLRCAGVVAAVTISRVSYPNRLTHESAIDRFACLLDEKPEWDEPKEFVTTMMAKLLNEFKITSDDGESKNVFETGKTRIYFKAGALEHLESRRLSKLGELATVIQRIVRGFVAHSQFSRLHATSIAVQALVRRNIARNSLLRACSAVTSLSCWMRCIFARAELLRLRRKKASTILQSRVRMFVARKRYIRSRVAAVLMQKIWKGALQRPIYVTMLEEAKEEARVNTKLAALQKRLADAEMKWILADKARVEAEKRADGTSVSSVVVDEKKEEQEQKEKEEQPVESSDDQKALLDESTKMLEYLRKQVFEYRSKNFLLRNDYSELKLAHNHVLEQYSGLVSSHEALRQHSSNLAQAQTKSSTQAIDAKKQLYETKKDLKISLFNHKAEMRKLTDLMRAKEKDSNETINRLMAEVASLKSISTNNQNREKQRNRTRPPALSTSLSSSAMSMRQDSTKKSTNNRKGSNKPPKSKQQKTRANFGRKVPRNISTTPGSMDDDEWGHDGFFATQTSSPRGSPTGSESSFSVRKQNNNKQRGRGKKNSKQSNTKNSPRVVSPHQDGSSMNRNFSTSSLKEAIDKKPLDDGKKKKKSSLAAAATKKSSLAAKVSTK